jgi:hypothetical protein
VAGTATNASAAKKALIALVAQILAANPGTAGVEVTYAYDGRRHERELVHAGRVEGSQEYATFGGGRARLSRDESLTIKLHVVVYRPGDEQQDAEDRCVEIGTVIEEALAAASKPDIPGLVWAGVGTVDLDGDVDDDGAIGVLTYDVAVTSRLT